ncbi:MAG: DUF937 domain-containing protein, partial [Pseudomonadota bacterium]
MAGLNLMEMISNAAGGQAKRQLGQQLGLSEDQTGTALKALLPALSAGLKANTQKQGGLEALLGALQNGDHDKYLDQPERLSQSETVADGNAILGHLLGSKDMSRSVASAAAQKTGIGDDILKSALPLVASMVMGSLSKQTKDPNVGSQLAGLLGGGRAAAPQQNSGLGGLLGAVLGGGKSTAQQSSGGL